MRGSTIAVVAGQRIPCVGAIITGPAGLLLIKRGHEPEAGRWSIPGGRIELGETDAEALVREVREETGLLVRPGRLAGAVERPGPGGTILEIRDYAATVTGGDLVPGDDAADARWVTPGELAGLTLTSGLGEALAGWGVLWRQPPATLIAEATRRSGIIWLTIGGQERVCPAWHVWQPDGAYVLTGPGEQPLPGLAAATEVTVTVPSKDTGGTVATWQAAVSLVEPGSPEWVAVLPSLLTGRLNAPLTPGEVSPAARWARTAEVFRLTPLP